MGASNIHFNLDYRQTIFVGGLGFLQTFIDYSMPILQLIIALLTVLVLLKKLFSNSAKK